MTRPKRQEGPDSIGEVLSRHRRASGLTLRQVEEATEGQVSNPYLNQLEKNKIAKPSPNVLHALAQVYATSYEELMRAAGYVSGDATTAEGRARPRVATLAVNGLDAEEQKILLDYLAFVRTQRKRK